MQPFNTGLSRWIENNEITLLEVQKGKRIINLLKYISNSPAQDFFDDNFNSMTLEDVISLLDIVLSDRSTAPKYSDYKVVAIPDYSIAKIYRKYARAWCITESEEVWNKYSESGIKFYFCINRGMEIEQPIVGNDFPHDAYGYSLIAIAINKSGSIASITSRWNIEEYTLPQTLERLISKTVTTIKGND